MSARTTLTARRQEETRAQVALAMVGLTAAARALELTKEAHRLGMATLTDVDEACRSWTRQACAVAVLLFPDPTVPDRLSLDGHGLVDRLIAARLDALPVRAA